MKNLSLEEVVRKSINKTNLKKMKTKLILSALFLIVSALNSQWVTLNGGTSNTLQSIQLNAGGLCFSAGNNGILIKSTNFGQTWTTISTPATGTLGSVFFLPNGTGLRGWIGGSGHLFKTIDGGSNWQELTLAGSVDDIYFKTLNIGYITGIANAILKTTNGGTNFTNISFNSSTLRFSKFIDEPVDATFFLLASNSPNDSAFVFRSTNNGSSWVQLISVSGTGRNIDFLDGSRGLFCAGNKTFSTTNGGSSWTLSPFTGLTITSVKYVSASQIYLCSSPGKIMKSTDTGINWHEQLTGVVNLSDIDFRPSGDSGIACGTGGLITKTLNGGITSIIQSGNSIPGNFLLSQNYPNPFNPSTGIKFNIAKTGNVSIKVYDIIGKEVATIINQDLNPGTYDINFDASELPSGTYFYRLQTDGFTDTKKMILIK